MSEIMWPLENVETTIYKNISEEPISIQDFASQLPTKVGLIIATHPK